MDISELLAFAVKSQASDLHISPGEPPILRVHGDIKRIKVPPLTQEDTRAMIYDIMTDAQQAKFEEGWQLDFSFPLGNLARFRVNAYYLNRGVGAAFRQIPTEILTLEQLGVPQILYDLCEHERGLVLVTGPTGSGKSTTLAAMIDHINKNHQGHILTIEDPIEFVHKPRSCLVTHREVGEHTHSFADALKAALRQDPDIILVGEMRDLETISLAISAAETGHLVFGTLHTNSAAKTIDRIIDVFPAAEKEMVRAMLSESLQGVISQSLCKKASGGRVAAHDIMIGVPAVRNLIRENKIPQILSMQQTGSKYGMQTMDDSLKKLVEKKVILVEEARAKAFNKSLFGGGNV
ncbi:MAG: twitching motility protein PilT [Alphaproteobacteria bacterium CG_4_10_14_0_2_um_filter_63_37]|nr:MAG: twitching motility protein PilT [Proteobacteria bacterium CG1_02_64_396]PJA26091.1 MAG: twitching motility protein PilT [Alphaproteobacteria bacterium CG_4_10_14_0_2_um_filter_63_37]